MDLYAYLLLPTGVAATEVARKAEAEAMTAHFRHLGDLREGRTLQIAGVGGQADFGLIVFKSESLATARVTMYNDPLVSEKLMTGMCVPFQFVMRGDLVAELA